MAKRIVRKKAPRRRMVGANTGTTPQGMASAANSFGSYQQTAMIERALSQSGQAQSAAQVPRTANVGATQVVPRTANVGATQVVPRTANIGATQGLSAQTQSAVGMSAQARTGKAQGRSAQTQSAAGMSAQARTGMAQGQAGSATTDFTASFQQAEQARQAGQQPRGIAPHFEGANAYDPDIGYFRVPRGRSGMEVVNELKDVLGIGN